jgi:hypothetical protein
VSRSALAVLAFALLASCTHRATQLVAVVEGDLASDQYACVGVVVSRVDGTIVTPGDRRMYEVPALVEIPFSFGVTPPDGDASRRVQVTAEAWPTCADPAPGAVPVVSRSVRSGFLAEQTLRVSVFLADRCRAVTCSDAQTCDPTTGACVGIPDVPPMAITPGDELSDAGMPSTDAARADAGAPAMCTPVAALDYFPTAGTAFDVVARPIAGDFLLFADVGTSVAVQESAINGTDQFALAPLDVTTGAWGVGAVTLTGTDDVLLGVWRAGISRVDRHSLRNGMPDVATANALLGSLRQRGITTTLGADALIAHDEQGTGDPLVLRRMTAAGAIGEVFRSTVARDVGLGSRATGGALVALTDGTTPGACGVLSISAAGAASAITAVPVDTVCASVAIAELSDGRVVLAFVDGAAAARRARYLLLDAALTTPGASFDLGAAGVGRMSVSAGVDGSFRVVWDGTTAISTVHVDADGTVAALESFTAAGGDYAAMRSARLARTTAIVFPGGPGLTFAAVCD